jgi:hypothetical protein
MSKQRVMSIIKMCESTIEAKYTSAKERGSPTDPVIVIQVYENEPENFQEAMQLIEVEDAGTGTLQVRVNLGSAQRLANILDERSGPGTRIARELRTRNPIKNRIILLDTSRDLSGLVFFTIPAARWRDVF